MTTTDHEWLLTPGVALRTPGESLLNPPLRLVFGRMQRDGVSRSDPGLAVKLDLEKIGESRWAVTSRAVPLFCVRSLEDLTPFLENILTTYAVQSCRDRLVFHAAAVEINKQGLLILGDSGGGKSTLALWLASQGAIYHGDEIIFMRLQDGRFESFPKAAALKEGCFDLFPATDTFVGPQRGPLRFYQPPTSSASAAEIAPLCGILVVNHTPSSAGVLSELAAHEMALLLVQQCLGGLRRQKSSLEAIAALARMPARLLEYSDVRTAGPAVLKWCGG